MRAMPVLVLLAGLPFGVELSSQPLPATGSRAAEGDTGPHFNAGVDLVTLNVVVTDASHQVVTGLPADAFEIIEDGVRQTAIFFATESVPTDLAVVADTSASMADKMTGLQRAATGFLGMIRPGDRVMIVGVTGRPTLMHPLGAPPADAAAAIWRARAGGNTVLYNGIYLAMHELARQRTSDEIRHQVLTVFSDGEDTRSVVAFEDVLVQARRVGLSAYTMLLQRPAVTKSQQMSRDRARATFAMRDLARETGGRAYFPASMTEVPDIYRAIAADIAGRYTLGYVSTNPTKDGRFRRIQVRMRGIAAQARTRSGYYASSVSAE